MSEQNKVEVEEVAEATEAAASLKPSATKSQMLSDLMSKVAGMSKQDLSSFLDKTLAQVGKEADTNPHGADKNKASIKQGGAGVPAPAAAPSKAMKEDMDELLSGQEDLSEDFRTKATVIFEAAVNNRVALEVARLEEQFEQALEEQVSSSIEELHAQIDNYMDYIVEKWMEENQVALENNFRVEATENFIEGLKNLFAESYVEVPEEKVDLIDELVTHAAELEIALEEVAAENMELTKLINEASVDATFEEVSEGLVETQVEKLRSLAEGIEFADAVEYGEKLKIIKEQYFTESRKEEGSTGLINEEVSIGSNDVSEEPVRVSPEMQHYFAAIKNTIRK